MKIGIGPVVLNDIEGARGELLGQKQGRSGQLRALAAWVWTLAASATNQHFSALCEKFVRAEHELRTGWCGLQISNLTLSLQPFPNHCCGFN